ncbi:C10 family peptidase [Taibaiella koreensis]|uniref:C10 family peptidase n=1 Tax=Taibaiella koreensis TaxID=1268548 RepID=UPI000E599FB7|nr:C10 family peptidase [Taibaiella koreensis]
MKTVFRRCTCSIWFTTTSAVIDAIRKEEITDDIDGNRSSWLQIGLRAPAVYDNRVLNLLRTIERLSICAPDVIGFKGPWLNNNWGQQCTYNNLIPVGGCTEDCGRAPTGCVATAGAILAHFWAAPSTVYNYNYAAMNRNAGDTGVQRLMLNVGQTVNMNWACGGSDAKTKDLRNFFGNYLYYGAFGEYDDYDNNAGRWTIKADIDAGRPVILDGCTQQVNWLQLHFKHGKCHTWLCDGYRVSANPCRSTSFHLHMNWGWDGNENGFYFQTGNWATDAAYQYSRSILHNVHP